MRLYSFSFLLGILAVQSFAALPDLEIFLWLILPAGLFFWKSATRVLAFFIFGGLWLGIQANFRLADELPVALEGRDLQVTGFVKNLPDVKARRTRFVFKVTSFDRKKYGGSVPKTIQLSWYQNRPDIRVGQLWQLTVRLKRPHGLMNPGGFDYESWLFQRGIRATGYVREKEKNNLLSQQLTLAPLAMPRQWVFDRLSESADKLNNKGTIMALALGYKSEMSPSIFELLRKTGTSHLMAISGLHIGFLAVIAYGLAKLFWRYSTVINRRWTRPGFAAAVAIFAAVIYAMLAGFSIPTQRALIMLSAFFIGRILLRRNFAAFDHFSLALMVVLIVDPFAAMSPGFWLSFMAVGIILFVFSGRNGQAEFWRRWGFIQLAIALALLPMTAYFFQMTSLVGPLANLLAIPWVSFIVVPLVLAGTLFSLIHAEIGRSLLWLADQSIDVLWLSLQSLAEFQYAYWMLSEPPVWVVILAVTGILLLLLPRGIPGRLAGLFMLVPLFTVKPVVPELGGMHFYLLDVGQGLSAVVQTRNHVLLFDTGARFSRYFDAGKAVVIPFLQAQGLTSLDTVVISHFDNDHVGGLDSILKVMPVEKIIAGGALRSSKRSQFGINERCQRGDAWRWDGVLFEFIHPATDFVFKGRNNGSCVLSVTSAGGRLLLAGDIEKEAEQALLTDERLGSAKAALKKVDVLVVPHHGSRSSSSDAFINYFQPEYVLYPVGYLNRYHFPHPDVVAQYQHTGAQAFSTAGDGMIQITISPDAGVSEPILYRRTSKNYWHDTAQK